MGTKQHPGAFDCYDHAEPDEPMFVLLARDSAAPDTVRSWAHVREARLRNSDATCTAAEVMAELDQINEARQCADAMEQWREQRDQRRISEKRVGAMLECGCWWADPPGGVERGYITECPTHGTVGLWQPNVRLMEGDDGTSEYISNAFTSR